MDIKVVLLPKRTIERLYRGTIAPRSRHEDDRRREFILNVILLGSLVLFAWADAYLFYSHFVLQGVHGAPFSLFAALTLVFAGLYVLSRRGYSAGAAYALNGLYLVALVYGTYVYSPYLPPILLGYALLIAIASILVSTRFGFSTTLVVSAIIMTAAYGIVSGRLTPDFQWQHDSFSISDAISYVAILLVIMLVSWLSNREIELSLHRARASERALREERNLLEVKVEERTRELRQAQLERMSQLAKFAEVGRLATGMIHDLLNPLTAVALNIEELERREQHSVETRRHLESAIQATRRMESLITAIRKRMSQQEVQVTFSLNAEISQVIHLFDYQAKLSGLHLHFEREADVQIFGDPIKFHQIVANLVSNAIDAYDSAAYSEIVRREVLITLSKRHEIVRLTVQDWGAGIPQEHLSKVFDPFFTTKEVNKGTGLGLATVQNLVEKVFGGAIKIESVAGKGTTMTVEFAG